jgi:hypothetical protein
VHHCAHFRYTALTVRKTPANNHAKDLRDTFSSVHVISTGACYKFIIIYEAQKTRCKQICSKRLLISRACGELYVTERARCFHEPVINGCNVYIDQPLISLRTTSIILLSDKDYPVVLFINQKYLKCYECQCPALLLNTISVPALRQGGIAYAPADIMYP